MKRTNTLYLFAALAMGGATMCAPSCQADPLSGFFLGGSFGRSQNEYDLGFVDAAYEGSAVAAGDKLKLTSSSVQRTANAWWANLGYMFTPYFGIDASFLHLGELTHRAAGTLEAPSGTYPAIISATVTSHGPALSLLGRFPLTDSFDVDVRLGDYDGKTDLTEGLYFNSRYRVAPTSASASSLLAGMGVAYNFAAHWTVRLDYLRINQAGNDKTVGSYSVNMATAGATFTF
jgi:opacity protein-like surface antigen